MASTFYADISDGNIKRYQRYFLEMLDAANINNLTQWSQGLPFNREEHDKSYEGLERSSTPFVGHLCQGP